MSKKPRNIITDNGDEVTLILVPSLQIYKDPKSIELDNKYDVHSNKGFIPSSMGSTNVENFVEHLFRFYSALGGFCGFSKESLDGLEKALGLYCSREISNKYLRRRSIEGVEVLFPTEKFLKNQKIDLRD